MLKLSIDHIRNNLREFIQEHADDRDEKQHAQQFWRDFYACFGIHKSSAMLFEARVIKQAGRTGYIDSFIPSLLLVEQKSKGKNLSDAFAQAQDYFHAIANEFDKPRYIIVCDFEWFHLYDLQHSSREPHICRLNELAERADWFLFLAGKQVETIIEETPINRQAAYQISQLHEALLQANFTGADLETFMTRLLFCLFADDTEIFGEDGQFRRLIEQTKPDGSDTGNRLDELFQILNCPYEQRQTTLPTHLQSFAYINGGLFEARTRTPYFDNKLRELLVSCAKLDWRDISPAIFGAMFQGVLETGATDNQQRKQTRRELGAHYTSERNILKLIEPLFLNDLRKQFESCHQQPKKLEQLWNQLSQLSFLDPACGCGNFLVIAYRELRKLEHDVIEQLFFKNKRGAQALDIANLCRVSINQFYGIELDAAAVQIARVALYITDHQLNLMAARRFGKARPTVPLISSPHIHCANALRIDWNKVLPAKQCNYVLGNPPFVGKHYQNAAQKLEMAQVFNGVNGTGVLDYVCAWYVKSAVYSQHNKGIRSALVSTNSITQGEQVGILWGHLLSLGVQIHFAHRTFKWSNEGKGVAAVHCVIIGFGLTDRDPKIIYDYPDVKEEPVVIKATQINPYLVDAVDVLLENRKNPICDVPTMIWGNKPVDGGFLILTEQEKNILIREEIKAKDWIRPFLGADEFISNTPRYCLWLVGCPPDILGSMSLLMTRIESVKKMRMESAKQATKNLAKFPSLFAEIRQPTEGKYLLIPSVSSEKREFIPIDFVDSYVICSNANHMIPNATNYHFGILTSTMHNAWMRAVCGRLESRYRYSASIVYNNFPWPDAISEPHKQAIEQAAQGVLDARAQCAGASLADLYDPLTMPADLVKAHEKLDKAVDRAYERCGGKKNYQSDAERVAFLFTLYQRYTSFLPVSTPTKSAKSKRKTRHTEKNQAIVEASTT